MLPNDLQFTIGHAWTTDVSGTMFYDNTDLQRCIQHDLLGQYGIVSSRMRGASLMLTPICIVHTWLRIANHGDICAATCLYNE